MFSCTPVVHPIIRLARMSFGTELKPDILKTKGQRVTLITIVGWPEIHTNGLQHLQGGSFIEEHSVFKKKIMFDAYKIFFLHISKKTQFFKTYILLFLFLIIFIFSN